MPSVQLFLGDCLSVMAGMDADSVDAIVCDPPYMINFMGKAFDTSKNNIAGRVEVWAEMLRVAKPGAHLLAFGGDRTHHRMMCAIEDAGWELRTCLYWCFGSGFPKSHDVSKAIDRMANAEREVVGYKSIAYPDSDCWGVPNSGTMDVAYTDNNAYGKDHRTQRERTAITAPATDAAKQWLGWGSALKPAVEIIVMARKPLSEPTIAANVLRWGTGGINVDGCRVDGGSRPLREVHPLRPEVEYNGNSLAGRVDGTLASSKAIGETTQGRWPANLLLSDDAAALLDEMSGERKSGAWDGHRNTPKTNGIYGAYASADEVGKPASTGGASRYFLRVAPDDEPLRMAYISKASKRDRDEGLEGMPEVTTMRYGERAQGPLPQQTPQKSVLGRNGHPCVKPVQLMRWLVRLVTPPGGTVLDPFAGSGSTGKACMLEGFNFVGIEMDAEYIAIARARIEFANQQVAQMPLELT